MNVTPAEAGVQFKDAWIPAFETVSQFFFVIASDRRERGNLYVFGNL
jgi:hypothetical protein